MNLNIPVVDREADLHNMPHLTALGLSPDGTTLASGTKQGGIQTWNIATGKAVAVFAKPIDQGNREHILALCFSSDGTLLAACSYELIRIWEVDTGNVLLSINPDERQRDIIHGRTASTPNRWFFHQMTQFLLAELSAAQSNCGKLQQETGSLFLMGHTQKVETLAFSSDNKTLVSTGSRWHNSLVGLE